MADNRRQYTQEFKEEAVRRLNTSGKSGPLLEPEGGIGERADLPLEAGGGPGRRAGLPGQRPPARGGTGSPPHGVRPRFARGAGHPTEKRLSLLLENQPMRHRLIEAPRGPPAWGRWPHSWAPHAVRYDALEPSARERPHDPGVGPGRPVGGPQPGGAATGRPSILGPSPARGTG